MISVGVALAALASAGLGLVFFALEPDFSVSFSELEAEFSAACFVSIDILDTSALSFLELADEGIGSDAFEPAFLSLLLVPFGALVLFCPA